MLPGGGYANNSNYELKDLGISIRYDKRIAKYCLIYPMDLQ